MITLGHWGCFYISYPTGYNRMGKAATDWYFNNYIEF